MYRGVLVSGGRSQRCCCPNAAILKLCALRMFGGVSFSLVNICAQSVHEVPADRL
eukprot:COSAG02_NODE_32421_length_516_cov_1.280576_1_plen_54_part_10